MHFMLLQHNSVLVALEVSVKLLYKSLQNYY